MHRLGVGWLPNRGGVEVLCSCGLSLVVGTELVALGMFEQHVGDVVRAELAVLVRELRAAWHLPE